MHPPFPIVWYVLLEWQVPAGRRVAEGPAAMPWCPENTSTATMPPQAARRYNPMQSSASCRDVCAHQLLAGNREGGYGRIYTSSAGQRAPAARAGLSAFPCLCFPPCPPGYAPGSHLWDSTGRPAAAAHDTSGARPLALVSTPAVFP